MNDTEAFVKELSDELCKTSVYVKKNVYIDGDKIGFNSKIAIEKFKNNVKNMDEKNNNLNLEELQKKYIKTSHKLEIIKYDPKDKEIIIKIMETSIVNQKENRKALKEKLRGMTKHRTNIDIHKAKTDENISDEILKEYTKLKKISKIPVPEPSEILSNPEQYKPILNMVLNNKMVNQIGNNHPYIRYFKLIAEKLNLESEDEYVRVPISEHETEEKIPTLIGNKISNNDDDTDDEE
jgi:hypothetical protein